MAAGSFKPIAEITGIAKRCEQCHSSIHESEDALIVKVTQSHTRLTQVGFVHKSCPKRQQKAGATR